MLIIIAKMPDYDYISLRTESTFAARLLAARSAAYKSKSLRSHCPHWPSTTARAATWQPGPIAITFRFAAPYGNTSDHVRSTRTVIQSRSQNTFYCGFHCVCVSVFPLRILNRFGSRALRGGANAQRPQRRARARGCHRSMRQSSPIQRRTITRARAHRSFRFHHSVFIN